MTRTLQFIMAVWALALAGTARAGQDTPRFWLDDVKQPLELKIEDTRELMTHLVGRLTRDGALPRALPARVTQDRRPRVVLLSVSDGRSPARVVVGTAGGILAAVDQATGQVLQWEGYAPRQVKLDIVQRATSVARGALATGLALERSLFGLAFDRKTRLAFTPEELVAHTIVDRHNNVSFKNMAKLLERDTARKGLGMPALSRADLRVFRFAAQSLYADGTDVFDLFRGHRMWGLVPKDVLLRSARQAGAYLVRATQEDGRFVYIYHPKTDEVPAAYNILRHAGTVYSMLELYGVTRDEDVLDAAGRALDYLVRQIKPWPRDERAAAVVERGVVKLGGNALAILALAKYAEVTGDRRQLPLMRKLAHWIRIHQAPSGRFTRHKQSYPEGRDLEHVSAYYPGEAILAMVRLHKLEPRADHLDVAVRGARWLITVRDSNTPDYLLPHDHWLLYGLNELYRERQDRRFLDHAVRLASAIVASQRRDPTHADWLGSYYTPPRSVSTATRTEGLLAAWRLCRDSGRPKEAAAFLRSAREGIRFQLQTQFRPESAMYLKDPRRVLGGFHSSLTNYEIRIDYVQHNISAILALLEAPEERPAPRPEPRRSARDR